MLRKYHKLELYTVNQISCVFLLIGSSFADCFDSKTIFVLRRQAQNLLHPPINEQIASLRILSLLQLHPYSQPSYFFPSLGLFFQQASFLYYNAALECQPTSSSFYLHLAKMRPLAFDLQVDCKWTIDFKLCKDLFFLQCLEGLFQITRLPFTGFWSPKASNQRCSMLVSSLAHSLFLAAL